MVQEKDLIDDAAAAVPKRLRGPPIKWVEQDIDLIVDWFCRRDEEGIPVNYESWKTTAHTSVAEIMLQETGLINKGRATTKKAADKMDAMVKDYKRMRMKAEGAGWGTGAATHKEHI